MSRTRKLATDAAGPLVVPKEPTGVLTSETVREVLEATRERRESSPSIMSPSAQPATPTEPLPEALRRFFWDTDFNKLRWPRDREAVIARLLASGNWEATRWLRAQIGDEELGRWIERRRGRGLPPPRLRFWELIARLDPAQVDVWLAERKEEPWTHRHAQT